MNQEIDESEFYHEDFTTVSDWEILIADLEKVFAQWRIDQQRESPVAAGEWKIYTEKVSFMQQYWFQFAWHKKQLEESSTNHVLDNWHDFILDNSTEHCLTNWYGLNEYLILSPIDLVEITNNESNAKLLLSALSVFINNLSLEIPAFVQVQKRFQQCYSGIYIANGIRTMFDIVHLQRTPNNCQHLRGLLQLFKTKIMPPCSIDTFVSCRAKYCLRNGINFEYVQDPMDETKFPFGLLVDSLKSINLFAIWNRLSDHAVIDSDTQSGFNPMSAQSWWCSVEFNQETGNLVKCLTEILSNLQNDDGIYEILSDFVETPVENNPLDLLTESKVPGIGSLIGKARSRRKHNKGSPPIKEDDLINLLYFLFPDADESQTHQYDLKAENEQFKGFKSCSEDSLIWRLAIVMVHTIKSIGGLKGLCHIWYEFIQELRYRWENSASIPGICSGVPDLRTCLLHQKLQMLNLCIERKTLRETQNYASAEENSSEEDDDEFFDATDGVEERKFPPWDRPVGRLSKFGEMTLLNTNDPLYIPITQDPVSKTEDQLEEDSNILLKLGSDNEAQELRARIMSASLQSDMESFKAANPGSILEDFIRWYSPRDWIETEDSVGNRIGHLSSRMQIEDNLWVEMWANARPVPAHRQKRLFDDTREAEKVLQYLETRTISQISEMLIPVVTHVAISRLFQEVVNLPLGVVDKTQMQNLLKIGELITRSSKGTQQVKLFEKLIQDLTDLEQQVAQINLLRVKLDVNEDEEIKYIIDLACGKTIVLAKRDKSLIGSKILTLFMEQQPTATNIRSDFHQFPPANEREFVLRTNCVRPSLSSAKCPQFLRAILSQQEFRLVGGFSEDINFF